MLQTLMKDQGQIKIGNFVIQQEEPTNQKRNNTTIIPHTKADVPQISKSQQDIDFVINKPNDFVNDIFFDEPLPDLDQFIEQDVVSNVTIDSQNKPNKVFPNQQLGRFRSKYLQKHSRSLINSAPKQKKNSKALQNTTSNNYQNLKLQNAHQTQ
ncbi:hypothetical protein FGO68_gene9006 [Halteria grandinella]|uniref:Uncharacterized protein n=1 Tax=Halteria grandinella TaxID=5974 RepID=A0A8J8NHG8_HALGN|nr:hypothetical protein FGO68_gene9006 [Halteria grandinella]